MLNGLTIIFKRKQYEKAEKLFKSRSIYGHICAIGIHWSHGRNTALQYTPMPAIPNPWKQKKTYNNKDGASKFDAPSLLLSFFSIFSRCEAGVLFENFGEILHVRHTAMLRHRLYLQAGGL